jgi:hypothetical protein
MIACGAVMNDCDNRPVVAEEQGRVGARDWLAVATGLNVAVAVCYLTCKVPWRTLSLVGRVRTSIVYLVVVCVAGVVGTWVTLPRDSRGEFRTLLRCGVRGWVFLPASVLFLQRESVWAMLVAVVSAALMAVYVFRLTGAAAKDSAERGRSEQGGDRILFSTEVRLAPTTWVPFGLSVCLYGAFLAGVTGRDALATLLLAVASFLLVLEMIAAHTRCGRYGTGR